MAISTEYLRFVLGLKLKNLRHERGASLKDVAESAGMSISYLSEIEKGKKYPKLDKLLSLAQAFDVPFDDLVSMQVDEELDPLKAAFGSSFIREFPFELFGLQPEDLFGLFTEEPSKTNALIRTVLEIGRMYDMQVEHFLFAALRSYQQMHENHFEDLEQAAAAFRTEEGWAAGAPVEPDILRHILTSRLGYTIDEETLPGHPELSGLRSAFRDGASPTLYLNGRLMPTQKAFIYGREIGFQHLGLDERPMTSSWIRAESFEEVLNNFKASYFAGALLIDRDALHEDIAAFFARDRWDGAALLDCIQRYRATPEMFFYRLTELLPDLFGLREIYFMRFHNPVDRPSMRLTKVMNLSPVPVPHGIGLGEHYCRRWPAMKLLNQLANRQQEGTATPPAVLAQRSHFLDEDATFFVISMARPLALQPNTNSCVSLGFLINDTFRETVRFWNDPALPERIVNLTCERCPLTPDECQDRVAPPVIYEEQQRMARQEAALAVLLDS